MNDDNKSIRFRIRQNGQTVASAEGADPISAEAEIMHYARQYREDGEVTIQHNVAGHWKRYALLCQWPILEAANG
jgi:hypothetical protein